MVADQCRNGVLHTYEYWFFCMRTEAGWLHISRGFAKKAKSPSVMQAVMTLFERLDHRLRGGTVHPQSAQKAPKKRKLAHGRDPGTGPDQNPLLPQGPGNDGDKKLPPSGKGAKGGAGAEENIAASLEETDCAVYDVARNVSLLTNTRYPNVLIKMQKRRSNRVASEMEREATMYIELQKNKKVAQVIPTFYGFSRRWGVPILCLEREGDDFDDLGLQNLSLRVRRSALSAVKVLSDAGVLHNDLALRNFVLGRNDKNVAKVVDFGRASITSNKKKLKEQVKEAKQILGV
jgi:serine/threonine protein kinase